jgi:hypothetical protein
LAREVEPPSLIKTAFSRRKKRACDGLALAAAFLEGLIMETFPSTGEEELDSYEQNGD